MSSTISRKKCLIIAMDMSASAAGIVFKRIVSSMSQYMTCDIVCPNIDDEVLSISNVLPCTSYKRLHHRVEAILYRLQGYKLTDKLWSCRNRRNIYKAVTQDNYDIIISFVYAGNFTPIIIGNYLKKKTNLPWVVYSVDAIPAPIEWSKDLVLRDKLLHYLTKYIGSADAFFSSNPIMSNYQKSIFPQFQGKWGVVLTPSHTFLNKSLKRNDSACITFLYPGEVYAPRKIDALLSGFKNYLKDRPHSKLIFVGNSKFADFTNYESLIDSGTIERHGYTKNIDVFYERADVLIDLNANIENDVFLSSKVCNYLSYNKPIISISELGSPVRSMMSGYQTIIHCRHNSEEIYAAMHSARTTAEKYVDDRNDLRVKFSPDVVAKKFYDDIAIFLKENKYVR